MYNIRVNHNKDNPYVKLNKHTLEISYLSWGAKGLWAYIYSLDVEEIDLEYIAKEFGSSLFYLEEMIEELQVAGVL